MFVMHQYKQHIRWCTVHQLYSAYYIKYFVGFRIPNIFFLNPGENTAELLILETFVSYAFSLCCDCGPCWIFRFISSFFKIIFKLPVCFWGFLFGIRHWRIFFPIVFSRWKHRMCNLCSVLIESITKQNKPK